MSRAIQKIQSSTVIFFTTCIIGAMNFLFIRSAWIDKSIIFRVFSLFFKQTPVFVWAISYYIALFFVNSNLSFLVVTILFFLALYILLKDLRQAMFLTFIASLPLAKGKTFDVILIPRDQIPVIGLFDVGYYFPLYPSLVFLLGTLYVIFRRKIYFIMSSHVHHVIGGFVAFLFMGSIAILYSPFPSVVGLSVVQLILMGCIFVLPHWLRLRKSITRRISHILAAFVAFESGWVIGQALHGGPLGKYIEAILPLNRTGILSTEDTGFMRFNGTFFEPSIMGTFMLMHIFYFGMLLIQKIYLTRTERNIYIMAVLSALISIVFTGSRGIYGLFVVLLFVVFKTNFGSFMKTIAKLPFLRLIMVIILALVLVLSPYVVKRLQTIPALFSGEGSRTYRLQLNTFAFRLAMTHTFGVGLNLSPYYFAVGFPQERTNDPAHPHNIFFQILAETGLPGLIAFLVFVWLLYRQYFMKPNGQSAPYFIASVVFLLAAQFYPIFISQPEILSFFFLHAGLMNWSQQLQNHEG